ncbi:PD-(D/E)XK nuclease-like domain-containing protein [Mycobacterium intracellulare]|uniref:PD-(D/E)XK nuclease-like domain-containing protein n=1 Tax=Mycobacterium intracellulare TaxID=1767 RepID=UPI000CE36D20|nr:PD-(D/E)XK nuclease-like domain-containing protein [Mycobacterium intracellulare]
MTFQVGERVWWKTSASVTLRGIVRAAEERPGVQPDGERNLLYLDADQLHRIIPELDGVYSGISDIDYHADHLSLSSSGARAMIPPSAPAIFAHQRKEPPNPKPEYDFGHAAHKYVLGEGSVIVEVDADSWRSADARAAREEAWAADQVPLLSKDVAKAKAMADAAYEHPVLRSLLNAADGAPELSGYWHDPETGVRLRYRTDWLCQIGGRIVGLDYKTTTNAEPNHCARSAADYGYHMQKAWYLDGLAATEVADDADFLLAFQAKTPPFLVSVIRIRPHHVDLGRRRNRHAINTYAECTQSGVWPGYGDHIHELDLPSYAVYRQEQELSA